MESHPAADIFPMDEDSLSELADDIRRERVAAFLRDRGSHGATDDEMQVALSMDPSTQRPRRIELVRAGRAIESGGHRLTRAGLDAVVWVAY